MTPVHHLRAFVEGHLSPKDFGRLVEADRDLQALLEEDVVIPPYTNAGNLLLYIIDEDMSRPDAIVNVQDALGRFLALKGEQYVPDTRTADQLALILAATPKWLDLPDFYLGTLWAALAGTATAREARELVRARIKTNFRFLSKPPKWLQSPTWMFVDERPLVFVGQLAAGKLLHDDGQIYVFFDEKARQVHTCMQVA